MKQRLSCMVSKTFAVSRKKRGITASVGLVASIAVVVALSMGITTALAALDLTDSSYPDGTKVVADSSTMDSYKTFPTNDQTTSYDTTQYAGRLWTDKTVTVPSSDGSTAGTTATFNLADLTRDLDPTGARTDPGVYQVDKTASGVFLTSISVLSSSLETQLVEPVPLDIVLVLDVSGSMADSTYNYTQVTARSGNGVNTNGNAYQPSGNGTMYIETSPGTWSQATATGRVNYTGSNHQTGYYRYYTANGSRYLFAQGSDTAGDTFSSGGYTYTFAHFYTRSSAGTKIDQLHTAVNSFIDTISNNNNNLANAGYGADSMSRLSLVKFAYYYAGSTSFTSPNYAVGNSMVSNNTYNATQIVSPLTTYTPTAISGTSSASSTLKSTVSSLTAAGATAADCGMVLAQGVFDGRATVNGVAQDGARSNAKKVIIFFTDGSPTHQNAFDGTVANSAITSSKSLKGSDALVYSVAVLDGATSAQPTASSSDVNRFLHAMSSNYPEATGYAYNSLGAVGEGVDFADTNYYIAVGGDVSLSDAFASIASDISSGGGEDSTATGRDGNTAITITDYLGDYMEFKGLDGILYGVEGANTQFYAPGTQGAYHTQAQVQRDDASATQSTYTMWATVPSALLNPKQGQENVSLNGITIKVTRSADPKKGDTVTITIPPELIPAIRYSVKQEQNENTISTDVTRSIVDPLRIFYSVGPKASTLSSVISELEDQSLRSESATNESDRQSSAFISFMANAARDGSNGIYSLYNNTPTEEAKGTATVDMTLSDNNPYYYYVDEPLYVETAQGSDIYRPATTSDASATKYVLSRYWNVNTTNESKSYDEWNGAYGTYDANLYTYDSDTGAYTPVTTAPPEGTELYSRLNVAGGDPVYSLYNGTYADWSPNTSALYIPNGTAHEGENVTNVVIDKADGANLTETATASLVSTFAGGTATSANQYLGNNGKLDIPVPGTLSTTKKIRAGLGFDLPTDPAPSGSFTLSLKDASGNPLTQDNTYRALIRDAQGHPVDPVTHTTVTSADTVKFYVKDGSTFELLDGETIKITNLPHNATYQVLEEGQAGYQATVTDNNGESHTADRGEPASTTPAEGSGD